MLGFETPNVSLINAVVMTNWYNSNLQKSFKHPLDHTTLKSTYNANLYEPKNMCYNSLYDCLNNIYWLSLFWMNKNYFKYKAKFH